VAACARPVAILAAALAAGLTGCVSFEGTPGFAVSPEQWRAGVTRRGVDPAEAPNPMEGSPAMTAAARELAGSGHDEEKLARLREALLDGRAFTFEYEKLSTFSAAEAFEKRRGNCVSFTNLFIALGRSLGIRLQAALVSVRAVSEREGDLIVMYNHMVAVYTLVDGRSAKVYDFYLTGQELNGRLTLLDDYTVAAIRASNDGIAHLSRSEFAEAKHDLEIAVKLGPKLGSLYANLGLATWRMGDVPGAFAVLERGLAVEPRSPSLLQNLAAIYVEQGRPAEARAALAALDPRLASPFALIVRGDLLLREGDTRGALRNYHDAAGLDPKLAEPWIAIARVELARGRPAAARKAVSQALKREPGNADALQLADTLR
jgi:tetratricopeptide (TPR) repeat protein